MILGMSNFFYQRNIFCLGHIFFHLIFFEKVPIKIFEFGATFFQIKNYHLAQFFKIQNFDLAHIFPIQNFDFAQYSI